MGAILALALVSTAHAATVLGSVAGTPTSGCPSGFYDCTIDSGLVAPVDGIVTGYRVHHGAKPSSDIPSLGLRIVSSAGTRIATSGDSRLTDGDAVDTFAANAPVKAGERFALYSSAPAYPLVDSDGRLLIEVTIAPDANGDGVADEPGSGGPGSGGSGSDGPGGGGSGSEIPWYQSKSIEFFQAETPAIYRAAIIKRLPATTNLYDAVLKGWSQPLRCSLACQINVAASMGDISGSLLAMMSRTVRVANVSAKFPSAGHGRIRVTLTKKAARALKRYGRTVKVDYRVVVNDGKKRVVRRQTLTLSAHHRGRAAAADPDTDVMLAATVTAREAALLGGSGTWWGSLPGVLTPYFSGRGAVSAVNRTYYRLVAPGQQSLDGPQVVNTVRLFSSPSAAREAYRAEGRPESNLVIHLRKIGDLSRAWSWETGGDRRTFVRFVSGRAMAVIQVAHVREPSRRRLLKVARAVLHRVDRALRRQLAPLVVPPALSAALPTAAEGGSAVVGTTSGPAEAWAVIDARRDPRAVAAELRGRGLSVLADRTFYAQGSSYVIDATIFPFASPDAAHAFRADYHPSPSCGCMLDPGATGADSAYAEHDNLYELQFASGSIVGDVSCQAQDGESAPSDCEEAVRGLAARWYARVSSG